MKKTTRLKHLIQAPELNFLLEAHNGLSAMLVEEAGFDGIWASGLSISAALGVRDNNEASWTQVLDVLEFMSDATSVPILHDGDTGYGNFNSMRRLVRKLEQIGIAGVCIEDKLFPKTNSFVRGSAQPLADIAEFAGKIRAGKDAQTDPDFVIVARIEAFIAGWGLEEALVRAEAYREAGADAILIHSALREPSEILAFKQAWGDRLPVVIVPTKYHTTPTDVFRDAGMSIAIWANHMMRASLTAMRETARQIRQDEHLMAVEPRVAPLADVFRLQGEDELAEAERRYLPDQSSRPKAIVLAAARGEDLGDLTADRPKCMVDVAGRPLLTHILETFRAAGLKDLHVVRGYAKDRVDLTGVTYHDNDAFATTNELGSLATALEALSGPCVIAYGDVLFRRQLPEALFDREADFVIAVDPNWQTSRNRDRHADLVHCSAPCTRASYLHPVSLSAVGPRAEVDEPHGEWLGLLRCSETGTRLVAELLRGLSPEALAKLDMPALLTMLVASGHAPRVYYTTSPWLDIDDASDLEAARAFVSDGPPELVRRVPAPQVVQRA